MRSPQEKYVKKTFTSKWNHSFSYDGTLQDQPKWFQYGHDVTSQMKTYAAETILLVQVKSVQHMTIYEINWLEALTTEQDMIFRIFIFKMVHLIESARVMMSSSMSCNNP